MRKRRPLLYDNDLQLIGEISGAVAAGYRDSCEDMGTATLTMAISDPMNDDVIVQGSYMRLYDGDIDKGFYRITGMPDEDDGHGGKVRYNCDDAQCTLLDNQMPGYHQIGDIEMRTRACLEYILGFQNPVRWVLGECDFDDAFTYSFSSAHLLNAIYAIGETIVDAHEFIFDSTVTPWTMHLKRLEMTPSCQLIKGRNARAIRRKISGGVITRLYAYGYGEGDNQLTIASVNDGKKYIDADTIDIWGVREGTHTDTRQTDPATLLAHTRSLLEQAKEPQVGYVATAADIYRLTGEKWDDVQAGQLALVLDARFKRPIHARVLTREKNDVLNGYGQVSFELQTPQRSTADELNDLRDTVGIHELYAQGATTMYSQQFADNATPKKPAVMKFRIPTNVVRFNSILLAWDLERYRSPVAGAAAGGGTITTSEGGGGGTRTSEAGGGATVSIPAQTISTGVRYSSQPYDAEGSPSGRTGLPTDLLGARISVTGTYSGSVSAGADISTSSAQFNGATRASTDSGGDGDTGSASPGTGSAGGDISTSSAQFNGATRASTDSASPGMSSAGAHTHDIESHTHSFSDSYSLSWNHTHSSGDTYTGGVYNYSGKTISISGTTGGKSLETDEDGSHSHTVDSHSHGMAHYHTLSTSHSHTVNSHSHSMAAHTHGMAHYHTLSTSHSHDISHAHDFDHVHSMAHVHDIAHEHTIPAMTFTLEAHRHSISIPDHAHEVEIPEHTHESVYDIYEGTRADSVTLIVDGETVPAEDIGDLDELDICRYMRKNDEGKIVRGAWHTVEVVPDRNTRVVLNLFVQVFLQSRGAGDY